MGARESYVRALGAGEWIGFHCSLSGDEARSKPSVIEALRTSGAAFMEQVKDLSVFTDAQHQLVLDLLEHEAAHQGQLIRYLYGLELPIPAGWKARYALE